MMTDHKFSQRSTVAAFCLESSCQQRADRAKQTR